MELQLGELQLGGGERDNGIPPRTVCEGTGTELIDRIRREAAAFSVPSKWPESGGAKINATNGHY